MLLIVEEFLKRADFASTSYIFAFTTRFCAPRFIARIDKILRRQGKFLDAFFSVRMPQNYLPVFDVETPEQIAESESRLQDTLDSITDSILDKQKSMPEAPSAPIKIMSSTVFPVISALDKATRYFHLEKKFCANDQCTGCGTCEKLCLSGKIKMRDGRPVWDPCTACTFCFACIHYCPARAIQISGKKTAERGRYHHPAVSADDIAGQKQPVGEETA
jgi:ferredoxin